jgi:hypothetical protein
LATVLTHLPVTTLHRAARLRTRRRSALLATALTPLALVIDGFHPFTEDGGLYLAGVEKLLHPALFPGSSAFVLAPTHHSAFALLIAGIARFTHLTSSAQLPVLVFALHLLTLWTTLFAAAVLASRCWPSSEARTGALLLLACWLGLPIAGTSLLFMDPYLTARSFSTPCLIFALVGALDATADSPENNTQNRLRAVLLSVGSLAFATVLHPLMAGYALLASVLLCGCRILHRTYRYAALIGISVFALFLAAAIHALAPIEAPAYTEVALTRGYWFLSSWHWYELVGILAPTLILAGYGSISARSSPRLTPQPAEPARALALAAAICALLVTSIALLFAHRTGRNHLVAALQPMRGLQFTYLAMTLSLGATLGRRILRRNGMAWALTVPFLALPLYAASRAATPNTRHIEIPALDSRNDWVHAFLWIRSHTPNNALFALPSNYVGLPREDAQCFRAISERSALADYSKDGGEAAVAPGLTRLWSIGLSAQSTLAIDSDGVRRAKLEPLGISWLILPAGSATHLNCPYSNAAAKVCRLH